MKLRSLIFFAVLASCSGTNPTGDGGLPTDDGGNGNDTSSNPCSGGMIQCVGKCVDTQTDSNNCGGCGKTCGMKEQCAGGSCVSCMTIDKDKDGFNACDDCDDNNPLINPGAFEVLGNGKDDNCNGMVDEIIQCDMGLMSDSTSAADMAKGMDFCEYTGGMFTNVMANYTTVADAKQHQIAADWGSVFKPMYGTVMGAISTGIAADADDTKPLYDPMRTPRAGTSFMMGNGTFPAVTKQTFQCGNVMYTDTMSVNDYVEVQVQLKVPTNANSFAIDVAYLTAEYPDALCGGQYSTYDDIGFILLDSQAFKGNIAVGGAHGRALSVKSGLITLKTAMQLAGTGMDKPPANPSMPGGGTDWMTMEAPVVPRETITLRFILFDQNDGIYDTQILFDHFRWQTKGVCGPDTVDLGDAGADAGAPMCPDGGVSDAGGQ